MTEFGTEGYGTIEPGNNTLEEQISFSGITQNSNGTATLTGVKTVLFVTPFTESSGLAKTHAGSTTFTISNDAGFYNAIKGYIDTASIAGAVPATTIVNGIGHISVAPVDPANPIFVGDNDPRIPTQAENDALAGTGTPSGSNKYVTSDTLTSKIKFGGTGADGALAITSGATNIDVGGVAVYIKNYTSISITGTGSLTFSNPSANGTLIILKSQGNVTLTSSTAPMINLVGLGAAASAASGGTSSTASSGFTSYGATILGGVGSVGLGNPGASISDKAGLYPYFKLINISTGGGGSGGGSNAASGAGGNGGGGLYIECAGVLNFTTASGISVAGVAGTNQGGAGYSGAGGGAGSAIILYNSLTSASGTIVVTGGAGGTGGNGTAGSGSNGTSLIALNTDF
jgi:hypothetical protein